MSKSSPNWPAPPQNAKFKDLTPMMTPMNFTDPYDLALVGYFTLGLDGTIRRVNLTGARLLGMERGRPAGRRFELFVSEADRPAFNAFLQRVFASREKETCEAALRKEEKSLPSPEISGSPYFGETGQLIVHIDAIASEDGQECRAAITDITERRRAEEALSRERNQLKALLNVCLMADTQIREISSFVMEECIRISESELGFFGLINEDETLMTAHLWSEKTMAACAMDNKPVEFPCGNAGIWAEAIRQRKPMIVNDYKKPDPRKKGYPEGHVALSRLMSIPIVEGGKVVAVAAVANKREDYTESDYLHIHLFLENIWSIVQRQRSVEALRVSEERFRTVADFTYNWETWRGADGRYIYISPACERTTGYRVEEFMNDPDLVMKIAHPDDRALWVRHEQELVTGQVYNFDFRIITRGGEERWINHICRPVFSADGKSLGRRASNLEITLRKKLEIELDQYNQQLEKLVGTRTAELEELNTALKVLLQYREAEKTEIEQRILANMNEFVTPYMEKLKSSQLGATQKAYIDIVETNLKDILSPFLHHLSMTQYNLTPQEIQIATMIKSGRASKEIASILNVSGRTINFHRENIRKKLGLGGKKANLRSHLLSIK